MSWIPKALERCVGDVDAFAREHWGRRPVLNRASTPFDDLLGIAEVEQMLVDLGRRPNFRLVQDGQRLPAVEYTRRTRVGGLDIDDVADVDRILQLVAGGATVVLQGMERFWPPLAAFCIELESDLSHPVQANAYLSPPNAAGLPPHADTHDVLIMQVDGSKRWEVDGLGRVELTPGDVLYLPAGTQHAAHTTRELSLHITVGLLVITHRQVLRRLLDGVDAPDLDRPLPVGFATDVAPGHVSAEIRTALKTAISSLRAVDPGAVAGREAARRRRRARRRVLGRLEVVIDPTALEHATVVSRRVPLAAAPGDDDSVVLTAPDRRLRMPALAADALDLIVSCDEFSPGDLPGLDADAQLVLVRRLAREGIVERVQTTDSR